MLQRRFLRIGISLTYIFCLSFLLFPQAQAAEIQATNKYFLETNDIVPDNLIVAADTVRINGQVEGDLIAAGRQIEINGLVAGDVIAAGGTIIIDESASIGKNLRLAGGQIIINSKTSGTIMVFGSEIQINGPALGNIVAAGNTFSLSNSVAGSIRIEANEINLDDKALILGDFKYSSANKPNLMPSAKIQGKTVVLPHEERGMQSPYTDSGFWVGQLLQVISYWIVGILILSLVPRALQKHIDTFTDSFWPSLGLGFVTLIGGVIGFVILLVTLIGIPLALIGGVLLLITFYLAKLIFAFFLVHKLGQIEFAKEHNKWLTVGLLFLAIAIIKLIGMIPVIGMFFDFVIFLAGVGAIVITKWKIYNELYQKKLI